jgi:DNA-binding NarL/FixJ family response regulator
MTADKKQRDQISILSRAGLDRNEIANILRTTPGTVSVELSILKKMGKRRE